MQSETEDWNENSIIDVIASTTSCPEDYEQIRARFPGTDTICSRKSSYSKGGCSGKQSGWTVYGLSSAILDTVNGVRICVKRSDLNYHELVDMRSVKDSCCGSPTDLERRFCSSKPISCPLNEIQITNSGTPTNFSTPKSFGTNGNWKLYSRTNNPLQNPISQIYIGMTRPCGNLDSELFKRPVKINSLFVEVDECIYNNNGQEENTLVKPTGFNISELALYSENGLMNRINGYFASTQIQVNPAVELAKNNFQIWYKPYSFYSRKCNEQF